MQIRDEELRNFCIYGYNDGIAELQEASGGRIRDAAHLPYRNITCGVIAPV